MNENSSFFPFFFLATVTIVGYIFYRMFVFTDNVREKIGNSERGETNDTPFSLIIGLFPFILGPILIGASILLELPMPLVFVLVALNIYSILYALWDSRD